MSADAVTETHQEPIDLLTATEGVSAAPTRWEYVEESRRGDHIWWVSDTSHFEQQFPEWKLAYDVPRILQEIYELNQDRWRTECLTPANGMSSVS